MNKPSDLIVAHKLCSICSDMCQHSQFLRCATRKSTFSLDEAEWFGHHTTRTELEECGATSCHLCQLFSEGPWDSELYLHKPPSIESIKLPPDTTPPARRSVDSWVGLTCFITLDEIEIYDYARGEKASSFKIATLSGTPSAYASSTDSQQTLAMAKHWLSVCEKNHKCTSDDAAQAVKSSPSRLLEITQNVEVRGVRLVDTRDLHNFRYMTLSHSWGGVQDQVFKFTELNAPALRQGITIDKLPLSFQEAIKVARELGYQYLWIDALCIYQDSKKDWMEESAKMGDIYMGCDLNLAALAAANSFGGLFRSRDPLSLFSCRVDNNEFGELVVQREDPRTAMASNSPLLHRGWVFQEKLLSPRTLYFGFDRVHWECRKEVNSEFSPHSWALFGKRALLESVESSGEYQRLGSVRWDWRTVVQAYSGLNLTKESDRLIALAGVAARWQVATGWTYAAGLWKESLFRDLCWRRTWSLNSRKSRNSRAWSWSWVSVGDKVIYEPIFGEWHVHGAVVETPEAAMTTASVFVAKPQGGITIRCPLKLATLVKPADLRDSEYGGGRWLLYEFADKKEVRVYADEFAIERAELYCSQLISYETSGEESHVATGLALTRNGSSVFSRFGLCEVYSVSKDIVEDWVQPQVEITIV